MKVVNYLGNGFGAIRMICTNNACNQMFMVQTFTTDREDDPFHRFFSIGGKIACPHCGSTGYRQMTDAEMPVVMEREKERLEKILHPDGIGFVEPEIMEVEPDNEVIDVMFPHEHQQQAAHHNTLFDKMFMLLRGA